MEKELFFAILEQDRKTKSECKRYFENGTTIYAESEKADFVESCISCLMDESEAIEAWEKLDKVVFNGVVYRVDYVL